MYVQEVSVVELRA